MTGLLLNRIKNFRPGQGLVVGVPYVWLLLLFLIPFAIVLKISFAEQALAIPPYTPLYTVDGDMGRVNVALSYINYSDIFRDFFGSLWQMFQGGRGGTARWPSRTARLPPRRAPAPWCRIRPAAARRPT